MELKTRYSKTTGSFYPTDIDYGDKIPSDAIEVSISDFHAAMDRKPGQKFDFVDGKLVISDPEEIPFADLAEPYINLVRSARAVALDRLSGIAGRAERKGDLNLAKAADASAELLLNITSAAPVASAYAAEDQEGLKSAFRAVFNDIAASAHDDLSSAFIGVKMP